MTIVVTVIQIICRDKGNQLSIRMPTPVKQEVGYSDAEELDLTDRLNPKRIIIATDSSNE